MPRSTVALALLALLWGASSAHAQGSPKAIYQAPSIEIVHAVYGFGTGVCDATASVRRRCANQSPDCNVTASNNYCGDPAHGYRKVMAITYACGGYSGGTRGRLIQEARGYRYVLAAEGDTVEFGCAGTVAGGPVYQRDTIYIDRVTYGSRYRSCDATRAFERACDGRRRCDVDVNNELCGDPDKGTRKSALITMQCNGRIEEASVREGNTAILTCP